MPFESLLVFSLSRTEEGTDMTLISRRSVLLGAAATASTLVTMSTARATAAQPHFGGCVLCRAANVTLTQSNGIVAPGAQSIEILDSSGDTATDHFLGVALRRLALTFDVRPGFGFYDDRRAPNAFATARSVFAGSDGTVLMGLILFSHFIRQSNDDGMTIIAICAHEFGHIYQLTKEYYAPLQALELTDRPIELHADFLAGYFLAQRKKDHSDLELRRVGEAFYKMGDTNFNNPKHHGTSDERIAAIAAGYQFGRGSSVDIEAAAKAGFETVGRML
jgi:hypothetical protein